LVASERIEDLSESTALKGSSRNDQVARETATAKISEPLATWAVVTNPCHKLSVCTKNPAAKSHCPSHIGQPYFTIHVPTPKAN
jgi:hypothetical protein